MTAERMRSLLRGGEGIAVEYKRCAGNVESDVFESVCAFLNRFGGDLLLGVDDDGTVRGVNLFKYSKSYGGADPHLKEGEVFKAEVSLDAIEELVRNPPVNPPVKEPHSELTPSARKVLGALIADSALTYEGLAQELQLHRDTIRVAISKLVKLGYVKRVGSDKAGHWQVEVRQ